MGNLGVSNREFRVAIRRTLDSTLKRLGYKIILGILAASLLLFLLAYVLNWHDFFKALFSGFSIAFGASLLIGIITAYYQEIPGEEKFEELQRYVGQICSVHTEPIVGLEIATDRAYANEIEGASKIWMFFLTGRTAISRNLTYIENAIQNTNKVEVRILVASEELLRQLPDKTRIGLCPVGSPEGLVVRLQETIEKLTSFQKNLDASKAVCLQVKETNIIPTSHMIIIEKDGQTRIWYTPYMPGIESRETYRYIFEHANPNTSKFIQSFEEAWRDASVIC